MNWDEILSEYRSSGLSGTRFCEKRGISYSAFSSRRAREKKKSKTKSFSRVEVKPKKNSVQGLKLQYGVFSIHFEDLPDPKWLSSLLSSL